MVYFPERMARKEPQTRSEVEDFIRRRLAADEAETGLYDMGSGRYVVVDRVGPDSEVTFQWFEDSIVFSDLLEREETHS